MRRPPALVVGFSIHGLAVARALANEGVRVHCLTEQSSAHAPTASTRFAHVHVRPNLNTGPLTDYLLQSAPEISVDDKIVLFPTSDRIARAIADDWTRLEPHYLLSWAENRREVLRLQRKDNLAAACDEAGIAYPRSGLLRTADDTASVVADLRFPLVVKPAQPLSSFKAILVRELTSLEQVVAKYGADLPFVVQEWVEGGADSLYACTSYLAEGKPVFLLASRKRAAYPPGLGQGTVFESIEDDEVCGLAQRFLNTLRLNGPVAVEFKRDPSGKLWFIEPNVGRTEYCVDLVVQCGFNLPWIEYLHVTGRLHEYRAPAHVRHRVWYDTDKDPLCFARHTRLVLSGSRALRVPVFPYFGHADTGPLVAALRRQAKRLARHVARKKSERVAASEGL